MRVVGCGTGRCGTMSLSKLLDGCEGLSCTHEMKPLLTWGVNKRLLHNRIDYFKERDDVGDVALYYLNYIELLLEVFPNMKVVCLRRDKDETVKSFINKTGDFNPLNGFHGVCINNDNHFYGQTFPKYPKLSKRAAFEKYYDIYYSKSEELEQTYKNFKIFDMTILNSEWGQGLIFDHIGLEDDRRVYLDNCKFNVGEYDVRK